MVLGRYRNSRSVLAREKSRMPQCSVQHGPQHQGAGSRLCRSARPEGQPVRLPVPGRGRPATRHCDAAHTWEPLPVRRGETALLCGPDQGHEGGVPRRRPGWAVALREGTARELPGGEGGEALRPRCPMCAGGSLIPSQGGRDLRCSNFPRCHHSSPTCPGCSWGYVSLNQHRTQVGCSNSSCDYVPRVCPRCRYGILVVGADQIELLECSSFQATSSCTYTERVVGGRRRLG